jgi:hypothetical protein
MALRNIFSHHEIISRRKGVLGENRDIRDLSINLVFQQSFNAYSEILHNFDVSVGAT